MEKVARGEPSSSYPPVELHTDELCFYTDWMAWRRQACYHGYRQLFTSFALAELCESAGSVLLLQQLSFIDYRGDCVYVHTHKKKKKKGSIVKVKFAYRKTCTAANPIAIHNPSYYISPSCPSSLVCLSFSSFLSLHSFISLILFHTRPTVPSL